MVSELIATLEDSDFDLTGQLRIVRLERLNQGIQLMLEVRAFSGDFERQAWLLTCTHERASALGSDATYGVAVLNDHVLLAPYVDTQTQLLIRGPAADPRHVIADLWERHRAIAEPWFRFDEFLNRGLPLVELLSSSTAVLAAGPSRLLQAYSDVLAAHRLEPYTVGAQSPRRWVDMAWQPEDPSLHVLLLSPHDYIIGTGFEAHRVPVERLPPVA